MPRLWDRRTPGPPGPQLLGGRGVGHQQLLSSGVDQPDGLSDQRGPFRLDGDLHQLAVHAKARVGPVVIANQTCSNTANVEVNQLGVARDDVAITAEDLLAVPTGEITEAGLRQNLNVGVRYLAAWLGGSGCVPIYNLMEDAATAEISRTQVWQWVHHGSTLADGRPVTPELVRQVQQEELDAIRAEVGDEAFAAGHFEAAAEHFRRLIESDQLAEFLTLPAYEDL